MLVFYFPQPVASESSWLCLQDIFRMESLPTLSVAGATLIWIITLVHVCICVYFHGIPVEVRR